MVAMGTSLADRAWSSDSAVYRVSGVINVIGGWFLTAISAFVVGGIIVYLIYLGGVQVVAVIIFIILLIIGKNYINHKKENKLHLYEKILHFNHHIVHIFDELCKKHTIAITQKLFLFSFFTRLAKT